MNRSAADIFHEARDLPDAEHAGFFKGACGKHSALRTKVAPCVRIVVAALGQAVGSWTSESAHAYRKE